MRWDIDINVLNVNGKGKDMRVKANVIAKADWRTVNCKYCGSENIFRYGYTKKGIQRYVCNECKRTFLDNSAPEQMRFSTDVIASALNLFYESASLGKIQRQLQLTHGVKPDHSTIYRWIARYSRVASDELKKVPIKVGSTWTADETVLRLKAKGGEKVWFHDCIDEKTRFLLSSHLSEARTTTASQTLMEKAAKRAGKTPRYVVTDKLATYLDGIELAFGSDTEHIQSKPFTVKQSTNTIERFHGTLKDRTKVMRSFMTKGTARIITDGWLVHYNFFRPHSAHDGKTPAEAAGANAPFKSWKDVVDRGA